MVDNISKYNPLVSVIVPVYKAEKYLDKCVESIIAQTYSKWELILVEDGSPDRSGILCDKWAKKDNRIKVLHKENSGVSDTRNVAVLNTTGEKICFVDADDWVKPDFLNHLVEFSEYDYVMAGYRTSPEGGRNILKPSNYREATMPLFFEKYLQHRATCCAALYSTNIIKEHNIIFNLGLRSREDHLFNTQYWRYCRSVKVINSQDYIVRTRRVPIAVKFKMHSEDLTLVIDSLLAAYGKIKTELGYYPNDLHPTYNIICQYYLGDFVMFMGDDDYFTLYGKYFNTASKEDMYENVKLNSLNLILDGIIAAKQINNNILKEDLINVFRCVIGSHLCNKPIFRDKNYKVLATCIKNNKNIIIILLWIIILNSLKDYVKIIARPLKYLILKG